MKRKLEVAKHLTDAEYRLLLKVYAKHNSSMGLETRKNYMLADVVKVKRNMKEKCLEVHYRNGDWWHYTASGTWYWNVRTYEDETRIVLEQWKEDIMIKRGELHELFIMSNLQRLSEKTLERIAEEIEEEVERVIATELDEKR